MLVAIKKLLIVASHTVGSVTELLAQSLQVYSVARQACCAREFQQSFEHFDGVVLRLQVSSQNLNQPVPLA